MRDRIRKYKDKAHQAQSKGKYSKALNFYRKASELDPDDLNVQQNIANLLNKTGAQDEAIRSYRSLIKRYHEGGWLLKAIAVGKILLQLDPESEETARLLESISADGQAATDVEAQKEKAGEAPSERTKSGLELKKLYRTPLFADLSEKDFQAIFEKLEHIHINAGETIVSENDRGHEMFILARGTVEVWREQEEGRREVFARMREGTFFGEIALICNVPRIASVSAVEDCDLLVLSVMALSLLKRDFPHLEKVIHDFCKERLIINLLRSSTLFQQLNEKDQQNLVSAADIISIQKGESLLIQDSEGELFYVLLRGRCEVFRVEPNGERTYYPELKEGDFFGEISLLQQTPVTATVKTLTSCVLLCLSKEKFEQVIGDFAIIRTVITRKGEERLERTFGAANDKPKDLLEFIF